jgi:predicted site-specific integrase-resolvase
VKDRGNPMVSNQAAIYARYSSDNQREESIEAQVRAIKEYYGREGIEVVATYVDEAKSATTDDRPEFLRMFLNMARPDYGAWLSYISWTGLPATDMTRPFTSANCAGPVSI